MNRSIRRENLALFSRRLADPTFTEAQRNLILRLLIDEQVKGRQGRALDPCQNAGGKLSLLASGSQLGELC